MQYSATLINGSGEKPLCLLGVQTRRRVERTRQGSAKCVGDQIKGEGMVYPEGLEPPTCCLEGSCSIQLSYG
jgi:hypothetical protein